MRRMGRWNQIAVLVATIAIAGLPLVHNHPLIPDAVTHGPSMGVSNVQCAICATRNAPVPIMPDSVAAPNAPEAVLVPLTPAFFTFDLFNPAGSRAPPLS